MRCRLKGEFDDTEWKQWFAWYPVKAGYEWIWLEKVESRKNYCSTVYGPYMLKGWQYRAIATMKGK